VVLLLSDLDTFIIDQLKRIIFNGNPVTVYDYVPDRDKGDSIFPCLASIRHEVTVREKDVQPNAKIITPSSTMISATQTAANGGETSSGPQSYVVTPYPTPVDVLYEIMAFATNKNDNTFLIEMIFQAFPPGFSTQIGDYYPVFMYGKPIVSDHLELPLYQTSYLLTVTDLWLDRLDSSTLPSITSVEFATDFMT
jgi:hypothetical protein